MAKRKGPELIEIDLDKRTYNPDECPGIREGPTYLAKINGVWYADTFTRQHYGYNFVGVYGAGYQLDYPGWEELYMIEGSEHSDEEDDDEM